MKRKFLILSATLLAVCGAALLQSCSSEYEYYDETEEYGYYTEEEIKYINDFAEQLNVNIKANPEYYGKKPSIAEIESDIKDLAALIGKHKIIVSSVDSTKNTTTRATSDLSRTKSRSLEAPAKGYWYCIDQSSVNGYIIDVDIQWDLNANPDSKKVTGSAKVQSYKDYQIVGQSNLRCSLSGTSVLFGGQVRSSASSKYQFHFEIVHGTLNLVTSTGNFDVISH